MYRILKRILDLVLAASVLVVLLPVFALITVVIRLTSKGNALFKQQRAGKNGRPFTLYKFRTMRTGTDHFGPSPRSGDDPRLTRIGKFLREYSLDELPQLLNVLKGDMSLVGPRPLYLSQIAEWNDRQRRRLLVKPGLTGLAQISGRGSLTREEKLEFDVRYVESACLATDVKLLAATFNHLLGRKDIYEKRYSRTEETRGDKQHHRCRPSASDTSGSNP